MFRWLYRVLEDIYGEEKPAIQLGGLDGRVWTYITYTEPNGEYSSWTMAGFISHRPDLSDLSEPYLSAVKRALAARPDAQSL